MEEYKINFDKMNQMTAPLRKISEQLGQLMLSGVQKVNEIMRPIAVLAYDIGKAIEPLYAQINSSVIKFAEIAQKWQVARKVDIAFLADNGWYPNWLTFFYNPEQEPNSLDELMALQLQDNWDEITARILELCPNRKHILANSFELHKSGNYIAAIPLFYAQADGICCEVLKSFLFADNKTEENLNNLIDSGKIEVSMFLDIFLEPFKLANLHSAGISKAKSIAPNRNGILHGHRKHLDYGTEINSLKCFSLLSFVVYVTKELIPESQKRVAEKNINCSE